MVNVGVWCSVDAGTKVVGVVLVLPMIVTGWGRVATAGMEPPGVGMLEKEAQLEFLVHVCVCVSNA